jgi:uncharacterized protein (TIGR02588 family)
MSRQAGQAGQKGDPGPARKRDPGRQRVEWTSLGFSLAVVLGVLGLLTYVSFAGDDGPATLVVQPSLAERWQADGAYYLPLEVANTGGQDVESVRLEVVLQPSEGNEERAEIEIDTLARGESVRVIVVFRSDPAGGEIAVEGLTFREP